MGEPRTLTGNKKWKLDCRERPSKNQLKFVAMHEIIENKMVKDAPLWVTT